MEKRRTSHAKSIGVIREYTNGKQGKCGHTCYFCSPRGLQNRLLGSVPKPSSAQALHPSQPAKAAFSLALLRLLSPPNPLALGFGGAPM